MAKITTKKPTHAGVPTTKDLPESPISEPFEPPQIEKLIQAQKPVETSAVPTKNQPVIQKSFPQVKVTRTSEAKLTSFSPPAAPLPPPTNSKSGRILLPLGGVFLIILAVSRMGSGTKTYDSEFLPSDPTAREMLVRDDPAKMAMAAWKNEEPGFFGKFFRKLCLGYAKSDGCSSEPLHPFEKVASQLGITLKFEKEEDKKVIEQTIEYKHKSFNFGK